MIATPQSDIDRFWSRVEKTESCWNWRAGCYRGGYGQFWLCSRQARIRAHRFAYELSRGVAPAPGLVVMHTCDNPRCVRPEHLRLGTALENTADRDRKGRQARGARSGSWGQSEIRRGARNGRAKLDDGKVRAIRREAASGLTKKSIAVRYGVSTAVIHAVVRGRRWRHVC